ncbi:uncharacterized protein [Miscanthus floridulus]|uniref:uncharacterized protein n=1 Tax=Miscanthus floridulus TaxID=154761 RepID=UPI003459128D
MEIDEKTRFRLDFVRMKIACRDVSKVPKTAEGTLGIYVKDFIFEREIQDNEPVRTLTSGINVTDPDADPNKSYRAEEQGKRGTQASQNVRQADTKIGASINNGKPKTVSVTSSAPPKCNTQGQDNRMKTVVEHPKKNLVTANEIPAEKVHIPDTFEESDAESETLSDRIRKLKGYGNMGQSSKQGEDDDNHHVMFMKDISTDVNMDLMVQRQLQKQLNNQDNTYTPSEAVDTMIPPLISEDTVAIEGIINSQESTITMVDCEEVIEIPEAEKDAAAVGDTIAGKKMLVQPERRRSERLKRDIHLTTQDKMEAMAKKRCLKGLFADEEKKQLEDGVAAMLKIANELLDVQRRSDADRRLMGPGDQPEDDDDTA